MTTATDIDRAPATRKTFAALTVQQKSQVLRKLFELGELNATAFHADNSTPAIERYRFYYAAATRLRDYAMGWRLIMHDEDFERRYRRQPNLGRVTAPAGSKARALYNQRRNASALRW